MARKEQVTCDVCGAQKQETNHWFMICIGITDVVAIGPAAVIQALLRSSGQEIASTLDLCGEACVLKKVSELISKQ